MGESMFLRLLRLAPNCTSPASSGSRFEIRSTVTGSSSTSQPSDYHGIFPAPPHGDPTRPELPRSGRPYLGRPELGGGPATFLTVPVNHGLSSGVSTPPVQPPVESHDQ